MLNLRERKWVTKNYVTVTNQFNTRDTEYKRARYLKTLGINPSRQYSPDELKAAYRKMAKNAHPNAGGSQADLIEVVNA
jgi:hypothetical protein